MPRPEWRRLTSIYVERFVVALLISATTGGVVLAGQFLVGLLTDSKYAASVTFSSKMTGIVLLGVWGAGFGALIGTTIAFVALCVLAPTRVWRTYFPLTLGASVGLAAQFGVLALITPKDSNSAWVFAPIGPTVGGIISAAVYARKERASAWEMAKMQGRWRQVEHEANGIKNPADEYVGGVTTFSGNCFTVHNVDGSVMLKGTFSLDASVSPKAIDWIDSIGPDAGKVLPASYRLKGDTFIFIAGDEGARRPTEFVTKIGETMRSFVRLHPDE